MRYNQIMEIIVSSVWGFVAAVFSLITLGLIAGFSPVLYATQAGLVGKPKTAARLMFYLIIGVVVGTILLGLFFQLFNISTLTSILNSAIQAVLINAFFQLIIGATFMVVGAQLLKKLREPSKPAAKTNKTPNSKWALLSFAAVKTILSASGAAAIFLANGVIQDAGQAVVGELILAGIFLAAVIAPFVTIYFIWRRSPEHFASIADSFKSGAERLHYQKVLGILFIVLGGGIIAITLLSRSVGLLQFILSL